MIQPATNHKTAYLRTLIWVSAALVLATFLLRWNVALFLAPLNLTNENVFAAWFSGILLLLGSLHAADGFFRVRHTSFKAAIAWCVIAAMLLVLSVDEISSLHERIKDVLKMGPWLSFLPFLIVLLAGCAWSFLQLWTTPSERPRVPGLVLGFAILVSVEGQEYLERAIHWSAHLVPFRSAFEEGSELLGMLILINTTLRNSTGLFDASRPPQGPAFSVVPALRWLLLIAAAALAWPVAGLSAALDRQSVLGHPADWLAAASFFLSAVLLLSSWIQSASSERLPASGLFWLCAASALCSQIDPTGNANVFPFSRSLEFFNVEINARLLLLALCCVGAAESLRARGQAHRQGALLLACAGVVSAAFAMYPAADPLRWTYFASTAVGLATFTALALVLRQRAEASETTRGAWAPRWLRTLVDL